VNALDRDGVRAPRVPLGVFSKLMACLPSWSAVHDCPDNYRSDNR
jgi:hypothetical protein